MIQDGKLCCSECYNYIDNDTLGSQRRIRRDTIKDTDLSLSWSVQHTVRRNKDVVSVPNSSSVPQLTREQKQNFLICGLLISSTSCVSKKIRWNSRFMDVMMSLRMFKKFIRNTSKRHFW
jgi:hypothetical protein